MLLNITVGDKLIIEQTDELLSEAPEDTDYTPPERIKVKFNLLNYFFLKKINFLFFFQKRLLSHGNLPKPIQSVAFQRKP